VATDTGFTIPTLAALVAQISADLRAELPDDSSRFRRWVLNVLAVVVAGATWMMYLYLSWIARQQMIDRATTDNALRHAAIWGIDPTVAAVATGTVTFSGTVSSVIPAGTVIQRNDGVRYTVDAEVTYDDTSETFAVTAEEAGSDGNAVADTVVFLIAAIDGVTTEGAVVSITGGDDDESVDSVVERTLERIRTPPQGGAEADYVAWAQAALATVDNVWPQGGVPTPGQVTVYFSVEWDGSDPSSVIPSGANEATLLAYIEPLIPVGVTALYVTAPTGDPIDMTIALGDDTTANRAAVTAELVALFQRLGEPGGADIVNSKVRQAIGRGSEDYTLSDLNGDGTGLDDITQGASSLVYLGAITWA
tara:strand:- start:5645 stop:6736 length:1092 start_codon:yes stop_codon:yes gene_type:complete